MNVVSWRDGPASADGNDSCSPLVIDRIEAVHSTSLRCLAVIASHHDIFYILHPHEKLQAT